MGSFSSFAMAFMDTVGLKYQPVQMEIRREDLAASLLTLRRYVEGRRDLWHTIIHERAVTPEWIAEALATLKF